MSSPFSWCKPCRVDLASRKGWYHVDTTLNVDWKLQEVHNKCARFQPIIGIVASSHPQARTDWASYVATAVCNMSSSTTLKFLMVTRCSLSLFDDNFQFPRPQYATLDTMSTCSFFSSLSFFLFPCSRSDIGLVNARGTGPSSA